MTTTKKWRRWLGRVAFVSALVLPLPLGTLRRLDHSLNVPGQTRTNPQPSPSLTSHPNGSIAPPAPVFETDDDILGAIDICIHKPRYPGHCHVLHLRPPNEVYIDGATESSYRCLWVVKFLRTLSIPRPMTIALQTEDKNPPRGLPIVTHTTDHHGDHILFPTSYLLRDLLTGNLERALNLCHSYDPLQGRIERVYFRGKWRIGIRMDTAYDIFVNHTKGHRSHFDVGLTGETNGRIFNNSKVGDKGFIHFAQRNETTWKEKLKYQYLMTLGGLWSSQWRVFQDVLAGGVIVRRRQDKKEYWNYNLFDSDAVLNFDKVDDIVDMIRDRDFQARKQRMANTTKAAACMSLQPSVIREFAQRFLVEYGARFGNMISTNMSYTLPISNKTWTPNMTLPISNQNNP